MSIERIVEGLERREPAALARAISLVENQRDGFERLLSHVHARLGQGGTRRIGITGEGAIRTHGNGQFDPYAACRGLMRAAAWMCSR